jgi:hypothetical protein
LAANADHILAGGSMSILRRKGKQFKDRREKLEGTRGTNVNREILSNDILTLLQIFHDEANTGNVSDTPFSNSLLFFCQQETRDRSNDLEEA